MSTQHLRQALWSKSADEESRVPTTATTRNVRLELRKGTHWTPSTLPNNTGLLDVNGCIPLNVILDMEAVKIMLNKAFVVAIGIDVTTLNLGRLGAVSIYPQRNFEFWVKILDLSFPRIILRKCASDVTFDVCVERVLLKKSKQPLIWDFFEFAIFDFF